MHRVSLGSVGTTVLTIFICSLPFEDSILQNTGLGFFGSSFSLLPLIFLLVLFSSSLRDKIFLSIDGYTIFASFLGLLLNLNMVEAALTRGFLYFIIWITFFACLFWFKKWHYAILPIHLYLLITILVVSVLMEMFLHDFLLEPSLVHANESGNMRPRGFAMESSQFGYQVVLGFLFCGTLLKKKYVFLVIAISAAFFSHIFLYPCFCF